MEFESNLAAMEKLARLVRNPACTPRTLAPSQGLTASNPLLYLVEDRDHDPVGLAKGLDIPMLFLQGDKDFQITVGGDFKGWREGLQLAEIEGRATFKLYPGLNHPFVRYLGQEKGLRQYDELDHRDREVLSDIATGIRGQSSGSSSFRPHNDD